MTDEARAKRLKLSIFASLHLMRGPMGQTYLDGYMKDGQLWLWDGWYIGFQNRLHEVLLWPPGKEQVKALKSLDREAFWRLFPHGFMWKIVRLRRILWDITHKL